MPERRSDRTLNIKELATKGVKTLSALTAVALLTSGCTTGASKAPSPTPSASASASAEHPELQDTTHMSGGQPSATDSLSLQLQTLRPLYNLLGEDYVASSKASELSELLKEQKDNTSDVAELKRTIYGNQLKKSIAEYAFETGSLIKKMDDVDSLMEGVDPAQVGQAEELFTGKVYKEILDDISSGQKEPEDMDKTIAEAGIQSSADFAQAASLEDAYNALRDIYNTTSAKTAQKDLATVTDPEVKALLSGYTDYVIAKDICDKYSYGGITRDNATKLLATISSADISGMVQQFMGAIDTKDYSKRQKVQTQLYDLRSRLDEGRYALGDRLDGIKEKVAPSLSTILDEIDANSYEAFDQFEAALNAQVDTFNKDIKPDTLKPMDAFTDGFKPLDFTSIESGKKITVAEEDAVKTYIQFAESYAENGKATLHYDESSELGSDARKDIDEIYKDVQPLIEAAMQSGALLNVRFMIDRTNEVSSDFDIGPRYDPLEKTLLLISPGNKSVSVDMFRQVLIHELTHALIQSSYEGVDVQATDVENMKAACSALSDQAREQFAISMKQSQDILDQLSTDSNIDARQRQVFANMKQYILAGTINEHVDNASYKNMKVFSLGCESPSIYDLLQGVIDALPKQTDTSSDTLTASSMYKELKGNENFQKFSAEWGRVIRNGSLYTLFNEASRIETTSQAKSIVGHSEDILQSGTELPASVMSGLLGDTEEMRLLYAGATAADKKVIKQTIVAVTGVIIHKYPTLQQTIIAARDRVIS